MFTENTPQPVPQKALAAIVDALVKQGHPAEYAPAMATSIIFQADLDLRNAQISRLLNWLKQEHHDVYASAVGIIEKTSEEFERRVQQG